MRKLLIPIGLAFVGLSLVSAKKVFEIDKILDSLQVAPSNISGLDVNFERIKAKIKLNIFNDSTYDLNLTTLGLITIEQLHVFDTNGKEVALANVNQDKLNIPAGGAWLTDWIEIRLELVNALELLTGGANFDINKYQYKLAIDVAGFGKYTIG